MLPPRRGGNRMAICNRSQRFLDAARLRKRISMNSLVNAAKMRIGAGFGRLFVAASIGTPKNRSPLERPLAIGVIYLIIALPFVRWADYPLGRWMKLFPAELRGVATWFTDLGQGIEILVISGLIIIASIFLPTSHLRRRFVIGANALVATAAFLFLSVAGGGLTAAVIKNAIGRARPGLLETYGSFYFKPFAFDADFAAFPSGHSATAGAMAMSLALAFPRYRSVFIPLGALICISRQFVGAHWSSDTVMGWGVGVAFTYWLAHVFARRKLMFVYDADGYLRRKTGKRVTRAVWAARYSKIATTSLRILSRE